MKLIGYRREGVDVVGVVDGEVVHELSTVAEFWSDPKAALTSAGSSREHTELAALAQIPIVPAGARVICIGLNYRAHAAEGSFAVPDYPTIFGRWTASLTAGGAPIQVPVDEQGLDWEGEIAAYVGVALSNADEATAAGGILGYSAFNDLTARRAQKLTAQWTLGKNSDGSGPLGPMVTADEIGDLQQAALRIETKVNGTTVQDGNSRDMIFTVPALLSLISRTFTLNPGDVIATGTPEGVGYVRNPPWYLHPGDVVTVTIDRLGTVTTPVIAR